MKKDITKVKKPYKEYQPLANYFESLSAEHLELEFAKHKDNTTMEVFESLCKSLKKIESDIESKSEVWDTILRVDLDGKPPSKQLMAETVAGIIKLKGDTILKQSLFNLD